MGRGAARAGRGVAWAGRGAARVGRGVARAGRGVARAGCGAARASRGAGGSRWGTGGSRCGAGGSRGGARLPFTSGQRSAGADVERAGGAAVRPISAALSSAQTGAQWSERRARCSQAWRERRAADGPTRQWAAARGSGQPMGALRGRARARLGCPCWVLG